MWSADVLQVRPNPSENDENAFFCCQGGCSDTPNWYNGYAGANGGKGFTCQEYATAGSDRRGSPWCSNGQVTPGSSWTIGAKYNYPEKNCCVCGNRG
ncbi:unnamed protein product [Didymodactylos carnosus]|uniref:Uncharacterized protein n=1 Tax=Didymodactylos carnosus TaxID=1234261 RepID=A0A815GJ81_9BILA|nr:unnamed protein product [Didymodactylos carnosus]CAF4198526.1 unnamed protein product [Didymodactylos carnosus]